MPARLGKQNLVARPDRIDFRDRPYQPPLRSLQAQYPPDDLIERFLTAYVEDGNILDQGKEGACTGFGLGAVVNYIYWSRWLLNGRKGPRPARVSPHMLYKNARVHDEWEGEDYEGSSCRGAMKGWHKHGVCEETLWPKTDERPKKNWSEDAALRPLGAYYRVDAKSIADMQAAIYEVHAVYCSAEVHKGWNRPGAAVNVGGKKLAVIEPGHTVNGGHAFALVGYTRHGFIVQNSWNTDWGTDGFALLTYEDWIKNGDDAWVAALGAPMQIGFNIGAPAAARQSNLMVAVAAEAATAPVRKTAASTAPWSEAEAYRHAIVMGNDGKLLQRLTDTTSSEDNLAHVAVEAIAEEKPDHIAVYVHGGLNDEEAAINRARRMGPWFKANGIHPLFIVWRTGVLDALGQIGLDEVKKFEERMKQIRSKGFGDFVDRVMDKAQDAFDRAFEALAEKLIGKAVWSQMKQNAAQAALGAGGIAQLAGALATHKAPIHLLGHSAGSIMIGHLLDAAANASLRFKTCGLYAPACTTAFAVDHYGAAFKAGLLGKSSLHIDLLTDEAETRDTVGTYGKSLLYLVSRALEDKHKTPILGLAIANEEDGKGKEMELNTDLHRNAYSAWRKLTDRFAVTIEAHGGPKVKTGPREIIDIAHGSFDNDLKVVNNSLKRILGCEPGVKIADLSGF
jgi:hypothetical protein